MAKTKTKSIHNAIELHIRKEPEIGKTYSSKDVRGKLIRDITPIEIGEEQFALEVHAGPAKNGETQSIIVLDEDAMIPRKDIVTWNSDGKLELTSKAKKLVDDNPSLNEWRLLRQKLSFKHVIEGVGKLQHYLKKGVVLSRNEPLAGIGKSAPKNPPKKKTSGKSNGDAQSDRSKNGKEFQMENDQKVVLPAIKHTNFDYIYEPNAGGNFAELAKHYNPDYYEVQRNGHPNFFGEVNDTDGGTAHSLVPQVPVINFTTKVVIKEHGTNLIKDAKNNAELGIATVIILGRPESFGWFKGKTDKTKPRKHLRMLMNLEAQLKPLMEDHGFDDNPVGVFIDDETGLDDRAFSETPLRRISELPDFIEEIHSEYTDWLERVVAPQPDESSEIRVKRIIRALDMKYAVCTSKTREWVEASKGQDENWSRPNTPFTWEQALALMDAYRDRTIRF